MGRQSRQRVCGERNGRTVFAPTHICADYRKFRKKIRNGEVPKRRNVGFLQNQKFDERDVEGAVPYMICVVFIQCNIQQVCGFDGRTMFAPTGVVLTPTEKALGVRALGDYFSVLNGASGMPVSLKIVTSQ